MSQPRVSRFVPEPQFNLAHRKATDLLLSVLDGKQLKVEVKEEFDRDVIRELWNIVKTNAMYCYLRVHDCSMIRIWLG